jgi:hypothetical protein
MNSLESFSMYLFLNFENTEIYRKLLDECINNPWEFQTKKESWSRPLQDFKVD